MRNTFLLVMILLLAACTPSTDKIDLSGTWTVRLDSADVGIAKNWQGQIWDTPIQLPGTTDDAGLGVHSSLEPELTKPQLLHLTRQNSYVGPAWYAREIRRHGKIKIVFLNWNGSYGILRSGWTALP